MSEGGVARLVVFAAGCSIYALPIADVLEVREYVDPSAIPTLPRQLVGAINYHGDALAVMAAGALFPNPPEIQPAPEYTIVVAVGGIARLGLPAERLLGLAAVELGAAVGGDWIRARVALRGLAVAVLDARRVVDRAEQIMTRAASGADAQSTSGTEVPAEEPDTDEAEHPHRR